MCDVVTYFFKGLSAKLLAYFGKCFSLAVSKTKSSLDLIAKDAILGDEVFVAKEQFLIDTACDICSGCVSSPRDSFQATDFFFLYICIVLESEGRRDARRYCSKKIQLSLRKE